MIAQLTICSQALQNSFIYLFIVQTNWIYWWQAEGQLYYSLLAWFGSNCFPPASLSDKNSASASLKLDTSQIWRLYKWNIHTCTTAKELTWSVHSFNISKFSVCLYCLIVFINVSKVAQFKESPLRIALIRSKSHASLRSMQTIIYVYL